MGLPSLFRVAKRSALPISSWGEQVFLATPVACCWSDPPLTIPIGFGVSVLILQIGIFWALAHGEKR